jgi:hypothetical protein
MAAILTPRVVRRIAGECTDVAVAFALATALPMTCDRDGAADDARAKCAPIAAANSSARRGPSASWSAMPSCAATIRGEGSLSLRRRVRRTGRRPWKSVSAVNSGALAYLKDIPVTRRLPSESTAPFSFPYQSAAPCSIPVDCVA